MTVPAPDHSSGTPRLTGKRCLAVDDNAINRLLAVRALQRAGARVDEAIDGEQALDAVRAVQYDAIVMDCDMPVMDGWEATRRIRAMDQTRRDVPILVVTAQARPEDRERCLAAGMDAYLAKPVAPDQLARAVAALMGMGIGSDSDPAPAPPPAVDVDTLLDRIDRNWELLGTVLDLYAQQRPVLLQALADAFAQRSPEQVAKAAHTLAGSAGSLAATGLFDLARQIEWAAREGDLDRAAEAYGRLPAVADAVDRSLAELSRQARAREHGGE